MQNISSNLTLVLKILLPTCWGVFFGLFVIGSFLEDIYVGPLTPNLFRIFSLAFFFIGMGIMYFTIMRLKRVDMDGQFLYVSNYFKTARYPYAAIEKIVEKDFLFYNSVHITFRERGIFGKKIIILSRGKKLSRFLTKNPEVAQQLMEATSVTGNR